MFLGRRQTFLLNNTNKFKNTGQTNKVYVTIVVKLVTVITPIVDTNLLTEKHPNLNQNAIHVASKVTYQDTVRAKSQKENQINIPLILRSRHHNHNLRKKRRNPKK